MICVFHSATSFRQKLYWDLSEVTCATNVASPSNEFLTDFLSKGSSAVKHAAHASDLTIAPLPQVKKSCVEKRITHANNR